MIVILPVPSPDSCWMLISVGPPPNNFRLHFEVTIFRDQVLNKMDQLISIEFQLISIYFQLISIYFQLISIDFTIDFNWFSIDVQ